MFISGLLIVMGIPVVWLKPSLNRSESVILKTNDTLRSKRHAEFVDYIHHLIEKHANCADQQLAPLKPFGNYKPFETFVYPNGFPQSKQQFVGVPHSSTCTRGKMCSIQQQHTHTGSNHDPDVLNYMASSKELKPTGVANTNQRIPPYIPRTNKNLPIHVNGYNLRKNHKQQVDEKNRQIFVTGLKTQNFNKSMIIGQNRIDGKTTPTNTPLLKSIEKSDRTMGNTLASGGAAKAIKPQNCTCPNLLVTNNNSSFNVEQNLNILVKELQDMANFHNETEELHKNSTSFNREDILKMIEKFKALQSSVTNKTMTGNIETATFNVSIDKTNNLLGNLSSSMASISYPEISINNIDSITKSNVVFEETTSQTDSFESTSPTRIETNSTENSEILNSNDKADEAVIQDSSIDLINIIDNELGLSGAPALTLDSKDLAKVTNKLRNVVNDINNKTLLKNQLVNSTNLDDFDSFATLNLLSKAATINSNNDTLNTQRSLKQSLQNTTLLQNEVFEKNITAKFNSQNIDTSSSINSKNISLTNNGSFKTIHINRQSPKWMKNKLEIAKRKNTNKGMPNARALPSDMTGTSSRFVNFFGNLRQNASSTLSDESYAEPIVSEIYPAKKNKSPLSIYLHRIEEKSQISSDKPPNRNWRILKSGEYESENDDISTLSKDCDDYDCDDSPEDCRLLQQRNKNLSSRFPELFSYDTNLS